VDFLADFGLQDGGGAVYSNDMAENCTDFAPAEKESFYTCKGQKACGTQTQYPGLKKSNHALMLIVTKVVPCSI
jgi:hypothetical protein